MKISGMIIIVVLATILLISGCESDMVEQTVTTTVTETLPVTTTITGIPEVGPLQLDVTAPSGESETTWGFIKVKGRVSPSGAVVEIENEGYLRVEVDGMFESDYVLLDEGMNEITITAITGEETVTKTLSVTYHPDLYVNLNHGYPTGRSWLSDYPDVQMKGRVSDPRASVTVNGHIATVQRDGYFYVPLQLEEGMNTLTARAVLGDSTVTDTIDVAYKPEGKLVLSDFSLGTGQRTKVEYVEVTGTVSDPEAGVVIMSGVFNGNIGMADPPWHYAVARVSASGKFTGYVKLNKGKNEVTVTVSRGDDRSVASATVEYRPPLINLWSTPDLEITAPAIGQVFKNNLVTVTGTVDEGSAVVLVNGMAADVSDDGSFSAYAVLENAGENIIEVVSFNGWKTDMEKISVTFEPPLTVSLRCQTEPDTDHTREPITVTGIVNKPEATVTINGEEVAVRADGYFMAQVVLAEGSSTVLATATLGDEQSSHFMAYWVENGRPMPAPGQGLIFGSMLKYDNEVTMAEGETVRLPLTLDTKKGGPGRFSGGLYCTPDEYDTMIIDWPKGLEAYLDPPGFTAYPDTSYEFDLVITAVKGCSGGTYHLSFSAQMEGGFYTQGGIKLTVE